MSEENTATIETVPEQPVEDVVPSVALFERDEFGLVKNQVYALRKDGRIDWARMINPEHIIFNSKLDAKIVALYGKPAAELKYSEVIASGQEVDPRYILVLLQGFYELADLRGYRAAEPQIAHADLQICSCSCTIEWIPNREEPDGKISFGTADATMENTNGWGYLSAMAGNRAFVRAVRQGLRIPILGFDEIAKKDTPVPEGATQSSPSTGRIHTDTLKLACEKNVNEQGRSAPISFDNVKAAATQKYRDKMEGDPTTWSRWEDVPPKDALTLIKLIKTKDKK